MIDFIHDKTEAIAQKLLGVLLVHQRDGQRLSAYIVDTEAYLGVLDQASHSFGGKMTPSLDAMYMEGGHLYLYSMRGHVLLNIVCGPKDKPQGVMIRAVEPVDGIERMEANRKLQGVNLSNGPAKLTQALEINLSYYGKNLQGDLWLDFDNRKNPKKIKALPRIGIPNKGPWTSAPLRFYVEGNPYVSGINKKDVDYLNHGWKKRGEIL